MDILDFASDWGLNHELKSWNFSEEVSPGRQCENASKRRRLNPADPVQEEAWLQWLDSSKSDDHPDPLECLKHALSKEADQADDQTDLNDAEKDILNNLKKYLLIDPPEAEENPATGGLVICGEDCRYVSRGESASAPEWQYDMGAEAMAGGKETTGVSSSKTTEHHECLTSCASSTRLQSDDPMTPETGSREGRGGDEEGEELSDADSDELAIPDPHNCVEKPNPLTSAEDQTKWEELQISNSSHPASPSSSSEESGHLLHCFHPQSQEEYNTVSLVHLLTACAEATACGNKGLAAVILPKIEHISSPKQSTFHRIASYYSKTLQTLAKEEIPMENPAQTTEAIAGAFQLLHEVCPYNKFAHMTSNQAILEKIEGKNAALHIIDFDIMEGLQWPPLMAALAATSDHQVSSLKITALELEQPVNTLSSSLELTGRRLSECAQSLHVPFSFEIATLDEESGSLELGNADEDGEILVANCMLKLPHMTPRHPKTLTAFISALSKLPIQSLTLNDDASNCPSDFTEAFFEILHHSCALFDSVEASLSMLKLAMAVVETTYLAPRISSTVASICQQEKDHKKGEFSLRASTFYGDSHHESPLQSWDSWKLSRSSDTLQDLGFEPTSISHYNKIQAQLLLASYKEGYRIKDHEEHGLAICWGYTPLVAVSTWEPCQELNIDE